MKRITLTLTIDFDTAPNIMGTADELCSEIRSRIFGEGIFCHDTLVDCWDISTKVEIDYP